ncbi:MAG: hypothetical protein M3R47_01010 [Chloroflexota bacterium]|nr:hypothetical protein [Chloroflexota bacterium]
MSRPQQAKGRGWRGPRVVLQKVSLYWALLVGLLSAASQALTYYFRFGRWNTDATPTEYLLFFLAGTLGGVILILFMNRQTSTKRRWVVLIAFLLASWIALIMMIAGGLLGPIGVLLFPQIPWALFTWIGSWLAKFIARD